ADGEADQRELESVTDNESEDVKASRSERYADADFARALADYVRDDAVESHRREQQAEQPLRASEHGAISQRQYGESAVIEVFIHRADVVDRQVRVQLAQDAARRRSERSRGAVRPQVERHRRGVPLRERGVEKWARLFPEHDVLRVARDAD